MQISVPHPPGGSHSVFNETLRGNLDNQDITNRITNYPITSHGGPVMPNPGKFQCCSV